MWNGEVLTTPFECHASVVVDAPPSSLPSRGDRAPPPAALRAPRVANRPTASRWRRSSPPRRTPRRAPGARLPEAPAPSRPRALPLVAPPVTRPRCRSARSRVAPPRAAVRRRTTPRARTRTSRPPPPPSSTTRAPTRPRPPLARSSPSSRAWLASARRERAARRGRVGSRAAFALASCTSPPRTTSAASRFSGPSPPWAPPAARSS